MKPPSHFWIYILECDDGSFYTGLSADLVRRYWQHLNAKAGVRYTRSHHVRRIAQCWRLYAPIGTTLKIELLIKRCSRDLKEQLIAQPEGLAKLVRRRLRKRPRLVPFAPERVMSEAQALTVKTARSHDDPFSSEPLRKPWRKKAGIRSEPQG